MNIVDRTRQAYGKPRDPALEEKIISERSAEAARLYAKGVIKGRWKAAEDTILSDLATATRYARTHIDGRWTAFETAAIHRPGYESWQRAMLCYWYLFWNWCDAKPEDWPLATDHIKNSPSALARARVMLGWNI